MRTLSFQLVLLIDCLMLARSVFALLVIYKPQTYLHFYHVSRITTWLVFVVLQITFLFVNIFYLNYLAFESIGITVAIQASVLVVIGSLDALGCYIVSRELINMLKK